MTTPPAAAGTDTAGTDAAGTEPAVTAVVTGAAQGIGAAIAARLAADGYDVLLVDRAGTVAQTAARVGARSFVADVTDPEQLAGLAQVTPNCGVLINNAALQTAGSVALLDVSHADAARLFDVNLWGMLATTQALAAIMSAHPGASIVNISSTTARSHAPGTGVYGMTKAAVDQLTRALAVELGPLGIRCNAVAPGSTPTEGSADHYGDEDAQRRRAAPLPLARLADVSDVAGAVSFLVSPAASYITGQCLAVDGGLLAASGQLYRLARANSTA